MYDKNNIFARIIRGEVPAQKIYEDEYIIAIKDIAPAAPIHILVIPKGEYISFHHFMEKADSQEISHFFKIAKKISSDLGLEKNGYRILSNIGNEGMQTIPHMHLHILAGKSLGKLVN